MQGEGQILGRNIRGCSLPSEDVFAAEHPRSPGQESIIGLLLSRAVCPRVGKRLFLLQQAANLSDFKLTHPVQVNR